MSIKVKGSDRPLTPIEVSNGISDFKHDLNDDYEELSRRLRVKRDIIKDFELLLKLPPEIQDTISFGTSKSSKGRISFTTAARIAELKDAEDMLKMGLAVLSFPRPISKTEVENIVILKKKNQEKPIEDCIAEIVKMRPKLVKHFLFVSGLQDTIHENLIKASKKKGKNLDEFALEILSSHFTQGSVKNVHIGDDFIRVSLTKEGHDILHKTVDDSDILLKDVVNNLFERKGF